MNILGFVGAANNPTHRASIEADIKHGLLGSHAEALADVPTEVGQQRRRGSIWSTSSSSEGDGTSRRSKIFQNVKNMFTSKSSTEEIPEEKA